MDRTLGLSHVFLLFCQSIPNYRDYALLSCLFAAIEFANADKLRIVLSTL